MGKFIDLTGQQFNRLTALYYVKGKIGKWFCKCNCGKTTVVPTAKLKSGWTKSCGCLHNEAFVYRKHGDCKSTEYRIWYKMIERCHNIADKQYSQWGGRGIKVCDKWKNSYEAFLGDMGRRPTDKRGVDRIDNNGDYSPENCRWATYKEQANNRRNNVFIEHDGLRLTIAQWAEKLGIEVATVWYRHKTGKPIEDIFYADNLCKTFYTYLGHTDFLSNWLSKTNISKANFHQHLRRHPFEEVIQKHLKDEYRNLVF